MEVVMDKTSRALRRHHRARLIKRTKHILRNWYWDLDEDWYDDASRLRYNHFSYCSCPMCCNERQNPWIAGKEKLTMQERRADNRFHDQLKEMTNDDDQM